MNSTETTQDIQALLRAASRSLTRAGIPDSRREVETMLAHVMGLTRLDLYRADALVLDSDQQTVFNGLIRRRADREPLQYILGAQEFWGLEFRVTPETLIPRPETELLIEAVLEHFGKPETPITLADLCTGTGCLAVAFATLYPTARLFATDLSSAALGVARFNASRHGVDGRIKFLEGDLMEPLAKPNGDGFKIRPHSVDLVLSNPPYIPTDELSTLQPEVRLHEPRLALDGGPDGLDYYRRILPRALDFLRPGGGLFLEVGIGQATPVSAMARQAGWRVDRIKKDLGNIDRVVVLTKP
ncbi:MAG: peptide chain release factor N(5)-glutamine methyltransferase [Nitrospirae bacterium]|nr:peptide chain release factor N(5)-glutamine methyltransferase [Nitrospirota bacterium]